MGRPCKCCNTTEACKNENSNFSTPWIIEPMMGSNVNLEDIHVSNNFISGRIDVPSGVCETVEVDCSYYYEFPFRPCYYCGTDPYGQVVQDPFGNDFWCGIAPSVGFNDCDDIIYPSFNINFSKIVKLKSGNYTINLSGFDTHSVFLAFSKKCFNTLNYLCDNIDKSFFYPYHSDEYIEATILDGPVQSYLFIDCSDGQVKYETFEYPYQLSYGNIPSFGYAIDFTSFSFSIPEDCFLHIRINGLTFSNVAIELQTCECPEILNPMIPCIRPPRPISVLKKIINTNPDSFDFNFSIDGETVGELPGIKYVIGRECHD